jgi:hypothetical protein
LFDLKVFTISLVAHFIKIPVYQKWVQPTETIGSGIGWLMPKCVFLMTNKTFKAVVRVWSVSLDKDEKCPKI